MRRALFLLEFRRALVPSLSVGVILTLILTIIEKSLVMRRGENPSTAWGAVHLVILAGIAVSGLFVAARVFSEEFKRQHHPLLSVLPLSASSGWAVLLTAGMSSSILTIAAVALLRPEMVADREALTWLFIAFLGHAYVYLIGACLALALQRVLFVPLLGFPLAALVVFETLTINTESLLAGSLVASFGAVASMLFFAIAGWRFYVRGEFDLRKTRVTHLVLTFSGAVSLVLVVHLALPTPLLMPRWANTSFPRASASARYVALSRTNVMGRSTIFFASVEKGGPTGRWKTVRLDDTLWAPDEDLLWVATSEARILRALALISPPRVVLATIDTEGTVRSSVRLPGSKLHAFRPLPGRRALVLVSDETATKICVVQVDGAVRVLQTSGVVADAELYRASDGRVVVVLGRGLLARGFLFDGNRLEPLQTVPAPNTTPRYVTVVGRRLFASPEQALDEIERIYPRPPGSPKGLYVYDHVVCDDATTVFSVTPTTNSRARLEVWNRPSGSWKYVGETVADASLLASVEDDASWVSYRAPLNLVYDQRRGLAVYVSPSGAQFEVSIYDARLGRSIPLARVEQSPLLVETAAASKESISVMFQTGNGTNPAVFTYVSGSGAPEQLPPVATRTNTWPGLMRPDGSTLMLGPDFASWRDREGVDHPIRFE